MRRDPLRERLRRHVCTALPLPRLPAPKLVPRLWRRSGCPPHGSTSPRARRNALSRKRIAATKSHGRFAVPAGPPSMSRWRPSPRWLDCASALWTIPDGSVRKPIFLSKVRNPGNQWTPRCPDIHSTRLASPIRSEAADDPRGRLSLRKPPPAHPASLTPALGNPASACGRSFCHATPISGDPIGVARWAQDCDLAEPYRLALAPLTFRLASDTAFTLARFAGAS
jgi:hypothetical protein